MREVLPLRQQSSCEDLPRDVDSSWGVTTPKDYDNILVYANEHYKEHEPLKATSSGRQIRNAFQTPIALTEYDAYQAQIQ